MIIQKLAVQNIRSHLNSEISFSEGFNCIVGGVGSGKTSILLSIHFALFGEPLYRSYDYLLRDDKTRGQVTVEFEHAGKKYRITRVLKREKNRTYQDSNDLQLSVDGINLAYGKLTAVHEQLKSIIGIDRRMFEEFLWIRQERLKEILNIPPSERQKILDDFLGLSSYQKAFDLLLPYQRRYEDVKSTLERDPSITGISSLRTQYEEILTGMVKLQANLDDSKIRLEKAEIALKKAEENLTRLEGLAEKIDHLRDEKSSLTSELSEVTAYTNSLNFQINKKINELNVGEKLLSSHSSNITDILSKLSKSSLSDLKETLELINAEIIDISRKKSIAEIGKAKARNAIDTIEEESVCPTCRKELEQSYRQKLLDQLQKEEADFSKLAEDFTKRLRKIELDVKVMNEAKNKIEIFSLQKEEQCKLNIAHANELARLRGELAEKEKTRETLKNRFLTVANEITLFKVEDVVHARQVHMDCLIKSRTLREAGENQSKLITEKEASLNLVEARIKDAEEKLIRKKQIDSVINTISILRSAYKEVVPPLRKTYVENLSRAVQAVISSLIAETERSFSVEMDETYTPIFIDDTRLKRDIALLSGGERTWLALAYRIGLGQLIMEAKTGQSLELLLLDEPTEALGSEDRSIEALATAIANLRAVRQIITVTHSEELAREASKRIFVLKKDGATKIES